MNVRLRNNILCSKRYLLTIKKSNLEISLWEPLSLLDLRPNLLLLFLNPSVLVSNFINTFYLTSLIELSEVPIIFSAVEINHGQSQTYQIYEKSSTCYILIQCLYLLSFYFLSFFHLPSFCYVVVLTVSCTLPNFNETYDCILILLLSICLQLANI